MKAQLVVLVAAVKRYAESATEQLNMGVEINLEDGTLDEDEAEEVLAYSHGLTEAVKRLEEFVKEIP